MAKRGALDQKVATLDAEIAEMERVQKFVAKHAGKASEAATVEIARLKDIRGYLVGTGEVAPATKRTPRAKKNTAPDPADESTRMSAGEKA